MSSSESNKKLDYDPWDMNPATDNQVRYLKEMVRRLHEEADWAKLDTTQASSALDRLNSIRKLLNMSFEPMDGMDTTRYTSSRPSSP